MAYDMYTFSIMKTYLKFFFVFLLFSLLFSAVEFIEFNAKTSDMSVELSWSTATETENLGFIIERKTDSLSTWIPLVSYLNEEALQGQGTVSTQTDYSYTDTTVAIGTYYYRLSGVNHGNTIGLLDSLSITVSETSVNNILPDEFELTCYPNPFNPSVAISFSLSTISRVKASIYDINGRLIEYLVNSDRPAGLNKLVWNADDMHSGVYILVMIAGDETRSRKLILMK